MRALLRHRHASETIIGRVAEHDEDRCFLLDLFRLAALLFEFGKGRGLFACGSQPISALVR